MCINWLTFFFGFTCARVLRLFNFIFILSPPIAMTITMKGSMVAIEILMVLVIIRVVYTNLIQILIIFRDNCIIFYYTFIINLYGCSYSGVLIGILRTSIISNTTTVSLGSYSGTNREVCPV